VPFSFLAENIYPSFRSESNATERQYKPFSTRNFAEGPRGVQETLQKVTYMYKQTNTRTHARTHTHTHNRLTAFGLRQPG